MTTPAVHTKPTTAVLRDLADLINRHSLDGPYTVDTRTPGALSLSVDPDHIDAWAEAVGASGPDAIRTHADLDGIRWWSATGQLDGTLVRLTAVREPEPPRVLHPSVRPVRGVS